MSTSSRSLEDGLAGRCVHDFHGGGERRGKGRKRGVFCLLPWIQRANPLFGRCLNFTFFHQLGDALFFSRFSVVRSTQIFGVFKKKKIYHFQEPLSFEIILLIWKMSIVTAKRKTGTRTGTFFTVYCVSVVYPNMWMLTFNVVLGYQGILFQDFLWIFFRCFFFNPTDPISGNAFDAKRKK